MFAIPVNGLRIGDTVHHDGADRIVHAIFASHGRVTVYFTDSTFVTAGPDERLDVTAVRPADDADFEGL